jgi:hypothetical protein
MRNVYSIYYLNGIFVLRTQLPGLKLVGMFRIRYFNNPHFCTIVIDLNTPLGSFVSLDDQESASFSKLTP